MAEDPIADLGFARVDLDRERRTGDPEVVYAAGKTPDQVVDILTRLHAAHPSRAVLATRVSVEAAAAVPFEFIDRTSLIGPPERIRDRLPAYAEAGVTTLSVAVHARTTEERSATLRTMAEALGAAGLGD